jgi:transcriptional regulator with XRE-family HTH domain
MAREVKPGLVEPAKRVKALRKALGFNQKEFAKKLDISSGFLSEVESGKTKPGYDLFYNLSRHFPVNFSYLLHGEGEMFAKEKKTGSLGGKETGERIETEEDLLWYIENSPLFMYTMMGFANKFLYDNEQIIKKDIEHSQSGKDKEEE